MRGFCKTFRRHPWLMVENTLLLSSSSFLLLQFSMSDFFHDALIFETHDAMAGAGMDHFTWQKLLCAAENTCSIPQSWRPALRALFLKLSLSHCQCVCVCMRVCDLGFFDTEI